MKIISTKTIEPRKTMIVGVEGVGKSSFAAGCPKTFFMDMEGGLNDVECYARSPVLGGLSDVMNCLSWLATNDHDFEAIAIDTVDWLERAIHKDICVRNGNVDSIEKIPYGKGYGYATPIWGEIIKALSYIREIKKTKTILVAHCRIEKVKEPGIDTFDRYVPDLHPEAGTMLREWCDEVLFASFRTFTRSEDLGFNKTRQIAVGDDERFIRTKRSAYAAAKNRLRGIPDEIAVDWNSYAQYLPGNTVAPVGNIPGLVANGSSKKEG